MTPMNLFKPKKRNDYLLEVENVSMSKSISEPKIRKGFSRWRKVTSGLIVSAIMGAALLGGMVINTSTTAHTAVASQNPNLFNWPSLFCLMKDDNMAYLGGSNNITKSGWEHKKLSNPNTGIISIPKPKGSATALEQYGYFAPSYTTWQGSYIDQPAWPYVGTGGKGSNTKYGQAVTVTNADASPMFSNDWTQCPGTMNSINVSIANVISYFPKAAVAVSTEIYGWATTTTLTNKNSPMYGLTQGVKTMIDGNPSTGTKGLKDVLFLEFLTPIVIIGALGLAWTGIVKRSSIQAGQAAVWMIAAAIGGVLILTKPLLIPTIIDSAVGSANKVLSTALVSNTSGAKLCALPENSTDYAIREIKCDVWYTAIYVPWVSGQFGINQYDIKNIPSMTQDPSVKKGVTTAGATSQGKGFDKAIKDAEVPTKQESVAPTSRGVLKRADITFGTTPYKNPDWAVYQLDRTSNPTQNRGIDYSEIAYNQLVINNNTTWQGAGNALGASWLSILGAAGPAIILILTGFMLLGYQIAMLILIALSPIFCLVGVAPGWGRRVAMRWIELVVSIFVKRIILMAFLLIYIRMYELIIAQIGMGWLFQTIMVLVLSVAAILYRDKIMNIFTDAIDFGGHKGVAADGRVGNFFKSGTQRAASLTRQGVSPIARSAIAGAAGGFVGATVGIKDANRNRKIDKGIPGLKENILNAHQNVTPDNLKTSRLSNKDHHVEVVGADGKVDKGKAAVFLDRTKQAHIKRAENISQRHEELKAEKDRISKMSRNRSLKHDRKDAKAKYLEDRAALREETSNLNTDVSKIFGKPNSKGTPSFNKKVNPLRTSSKPSQKLPPPSSPRPQHKE